MSARMPFMAHPARLHVEEIMMAERNVVKPRCCRKCGEVLMTTAKGIIEHFSKCS